MAMHPLAAPSCSRVMVTILLLAGCTGVGIIGAPAGEPPPSGAGGAGAAPPGGPPKIPGTAGPEAACTAAALAGRGPAPDTRLRRLTIRELQTSTALLLDPGTPAPLANLDPDSQLEGTFSTSDGLLVSDSFASSLNLAVEAVATRWKGTVTPAAYGSACFASEAQGEGCAGAFIRTFGKKAFRRPITDDDTAGLLAVYRAGRELGDAGDRFATGLAWVVRAMLQSPHFLYLTELGDPAAPNGAATDLTSVEVASALSYAVLGMPPDAALATAADEGRLATADQRTSQALRLIAEHPELWKQQMRQFVPEWLGINFNRPEWAKDSKAVPLFSPALKAALQAETDLFIDDWASGGAGVDTLLTTSSTFVNAVNAPVYGVKASGASFTRTGLDGSQRAGLLTMAGFLGSTSHVAETSPVMRGKAILEKFLCREPPPPPPMVPPLPPIDRAVPTTTRARFAAHLASPACRACHGVFEPMGDAFEGYDAVGAHRTEQNGTPIDSSGALVGATGGDRPVGDAVALARLLAQSPDTFDCLSRQVYRFSLGRPESDYDRCTLARASAALGQAPFDVRALLASIVASDSFVVRTVNR
jgi:hypothetical protein